MPFGPRLDPPSFPRKREPISPAPRRATLGPRFPGDDGEGAETWRAGITSGAGRAATARQDAVMFASRATAVHVRANSAT